jgi:branched-chain amino acid transport system ATP-binding protein
MALLEVRGLRRTFGGLVAVDDLSFAVEDGEIAGLIGPNGSGKTTTFNLITGFLKPDGGEAVFDGRTITSKKPYEIATLGLGRTFQMTKPFGRLTVFENMLIPNTERGTYTQEQEEYIWSILDELDLDHVADHDADELSGGQQKLLELARVLMLDPELVLLDEPAAGVNPALMDDIIDRVKALNEGGATFLVVEHDMAVIDELCERVIVMDNGRKIASGTFDEVRTDEQVREAYLG